MRNRVAVYVAFLVAAVVAAGLLWRQLRTARQDLQTVQQDLQAAQQALQSERNLAEQLRARLADASARPAAAPTAPAVPPQQPLVPGAILLSRDGQTTVDVTALVSVAAQREKNMLDDPEYHKARLAEARATLKQRNPLLARELGISQQQADAILDLMAEGQLREDARGVELAASGRTDAAAVAEMQRQLDAQQQQDQNAIMAMLGPVKYQQFDEIRQTQIARVRMVNLKSLMAQSGQPLTTDQELSLTRVVAAEQQREEKETQQLRASG